MRVTFTVGTSSVEFYRNWFTGRASFCTKSGEVLLQSALNPATHFSLSPTKTWNAAYEGRQLRVEKIRPLMFAGLRKGKYRSFVDHELVEEHMDY